MMIRFLVELFRPARKCARVGHRPQTERRSWLALPAIGYRYREVAEKIWEKRTTCRRCCVVVSGWEETSRGSIQTLTMNDDQWRELRMGGLRDDVRAC